MDGSGDGNEDGAVLSQDGYAGLRARKGAWGILTIIHISVPPGTGIVLYLPIPRTQVKKLPKE